MVSLTVLNPCTRNVPTGVVPLPIKWVNIIWRCTSHTVCDVETGTADLTAFEEGVEPWPRSIDKGF
jgi:hypothetical protein